MNSRDYRRTTATAYDSYAAAFNLSFWDTLKLYLQFSLAGLTSSLNLEAIISQLAVSPNAQSGLMKSAVLQVILLISATVVEPLLVHTIGGKQITGRASLVFHILWLYPLVFASLWVSGLTNLRTILGGSVVDKRGNTVSTGNSNRGLGTRVVQESYRVLVLANYLLFAFALRYIPYIGTTLSFMYCSVVNAYYIFEPQWIKQGWPLRERISYLESRWAFFLGFGVPITLLSFFFTNPLIALSLFSLAYSPLLLLTPTTHAEPLDPSTPATTTLKLSFMPKSAGASMSMAAAEGGEEMRGRGGSKWVPTRIRVLVAAEMGYGLMETLLGGGAVEGGGAGGGGRRKKDAGMGHGGNSYEHNNMGGGGGGGWRNDSSQPTSSQQYSQSSQPSSQRYQQQNPAQQQQQPSHFQAYTSPSRPTAAPTYYAAPPPPPPPSLSFGMSNASMPQPQQSYAPSTLNQESVVVPRRKHQMTESSVGVAYPKPSSGFDLRGQKGE